MIKTYILYHANCMDGLGSKFAAWKKYGDNAIYIPVQYGKPVPEMTRNVAFSQIEIGGEFLDIASCYRKITDTHAVSIDDGPSLIDYRFDPTDVVKIDTEVYILDFAYPLNVLRGLQERFSKVMVIDHHVTNQIDLRAFKEAVFDMNKSGAVLSWEYFHPDKPVPRVLQHVQDRDLWTFVLPETKEVHAGLGLIGDSMTAWDFMGDDEANGTYFLNGVKNEGKAIISYEQIQIERNMHNVKIVPFLCLKLGVINSGYLVSETGSEICNTMEVDAALMWTYGGKDVLLSFRSKAGSTVDVARICKGWFDGGGHVNAAGGRCDLTTLDLIVQGKYNG